MSNRGKTTKVPKNMQPVYDAITELTDEFCKYYLNDEYAQLARQATAAMCRKRPSPLVRGRVNAWACGIIYAVGFVNFLFDKSQDPYICAADLCEAFSVSKNTGAGKSRIIRNALHMAQLDPNWCLPSMIDDNPLVWMLMVDGIFVDIRQMPREYQEIAFQKGLIPYIPDDKK